MTQADMNAFGRLGFRRAAGSRLSEADGWRRIVRAGQAMGLLVLALGSAPARAEHLTLTTSHTEVTIRGYARWDKNCTAAEPPQVYLDVAPSDGTVCVRTDTGTVRRVREGKANHCVGRRMGGISVVYQPRRGFAGADVLRYTVKFKAVSATFDVDIRVQPDHVPIQGGETGRSTAPPQPPGLIPACAALVS